MNDRGLTGTQIIVPLSDNSCGEKWWQYETNKVQLLIPHFLPWCRDASSYVITAPCLDDCTNGKDFISCKVARNMEKLDTA